MQNSKTSLYTTHAVLHRGHVSTSSDVDPMARQACFHGGTAHEMIKKDNDLVEANP